MYTALPLNISKYYFNDLNLVSQVVKKQPYRYTKVRPHTFREIIKKKKNCKATTRYRIEAWHTWTINHETTNSLTKFIRFTKKTSSAFLPCINNQQNKCLSTKEYFLQKMNLYVQYCLQLKLSRINLIINELSKI